MVHDQRARITASLNFARALASVGTNESAGELRAILRRRHFHSFSSAPPREAVRELIKDGEGGLGDRIGLKKATHDELLYAIESEGELSFKSLAREETPFRAVERLYRVGGDIKNVSDAVTFGGAIDVLKNEDERLCIQVTKRGESAPLSLIPLSESLPAPTPIPTTPIFPLNIADETKVFAFPSHPGVFLLCNAIPKATQEEIIRHCLTTWSEPPQRRNTDDALGQGGCRNLWQGWKQKQKMMNQVTTSLLPVPVTARAPLDSLSWSTIGYTYDGTNRRYWLEGDVLKDGDPNPKDWYSPFPPQLSQLCVSLLKVAYAPTSGSNGIRCEAGIINFYRGAAKLRQPMGGHRDDGERDLTPPVISISLGCPAVFLLGGFDAHAKPIAIILRSGDTLILGGASRTAFHGVARVFDDAIGIDAANLFQNDGDNVDDAVDVDNDEKYFSTWIRSARLNLNVRQVIE